MREIVSLDDASIEVSILSYHGDLPVPTWVDKSPGLWFISFYTSVQAADEHADAFKTLCVIEADLSQLCRPSNMLRFRQNAYWLLEFEVEVKFGLTEYEARIKWDEDVSRLFIICATYSLSSNFSNPGTRKIVRHLD